MSELGKAGRPPFLATRLRKELDRTDLTVEQRIELMKLLQAEEEMQRQVRINMRQARIQKLKIQSLLPKKSKPRKLTRKTQSETTVSNTPGDLDILA